MRVADYTSHSVCKGNGTCLRKSDKMVDNSFEKQQTYLIDRANQFFWLLH